MQVFYEGNHSISQQSSIQYRHHVVRLDFEGGGVLRLRLCLAGRRISAGRVGCLCCIYLVKVTKKT